MKDTEEEIQALENAFPSLSGQAFVAARAETLAAGWSVLQADGGAIYEVYPDGRREKVKEIEAPITVRRGEKFRLR